MAKRAPRFAFGVIADVQYADVDDAFDFHKTHIRRYRHALKVFEAAVQGFKEYQLDQQNKDDGTPISWVAQLGDLIDGKCFMLSHDVDGDDLRPGVRSAMKLSNQIINSFPSKWVHLIGNHELYCFPERELLRKYLLNQTYRAVNRESLTSDVDYFFFMPAKGWRVVVVDPYELAVIGYPPNHPNFKAAANYLQQNNPNDVLSHNVDWLVGLSGDNMRFMPYNGMMSERQIKWLRELVIDSKKNQDRIIVLSHTPMIPSAIDVPTSVMWNYDAFLNALHCMDEKNGNPVAAMVLAGHHHRGGYALDEFGTHHVVVNSPLEADIGQDCYGIMLVFDDHAELSGSGSVPSRSMPY